MTTVNVLAEMAGSVWKIEVKAGDAVETGQDLIIIEAMKMEIPVMSTASGRVVSLAVGEGDLVAEGDLLAVVELE